MKQVTKSEFFQAINAKNLDVLPSIINNFEDNGRGYIQIWKFRDGRVYGKTHSGDCWGEGSQHPREYFLN